MSRGTHRKPRPAPRRLRRILAGLSLTAATVTGYSLTNTTNSAPPDTTWGAPDTTGAPTDVSLLDTTWG